MSVVIKEMEMPEYCLDCYFVRRQPKQDIKQQNTEFYCCITSETITPFLSRCRGDRCPLVDGEEYEDAFALQAIRLGFRE